MDQDHTLFDQDFQGCSWCPRNHVVRTGCLMGVLGLGRTWDSCASEFKLVLKTQNDQMFSQTATKSDGGNDLGVSGVFRCWFSECGENTAAGYVWCPPGASRFWRHFSVQVGEIPGPLRVFGASRRAWQLLSFRSRFWNQFWGWMVLDDFCGLKFQWSASCLKLDAEQRFKVASWPFPARKPSSTTISLLPYGPFMGQSWEAIFFQIQFFLSFPPHFHMKVRDFKAFSSTATAHPRFGGACSVQPSCDVGSGTRLCVHWISNPNGYSDFGGYHGNLYIYIYV